MKPLQIIWAGKITIIHRVSWLFISSVQICRLNSEIPRHKKLTFEGQLFFTF